MSEPPIDPAKARAKFPKVFGKFSITSGCLFALFALNNIKSGASGNFEEMGMSSAYANLLLGVVSFFCASAVALVFIGIGQLKYKRWARVATLVWSICFLAFLAVTEVVIFAVIIPGTSESEQAWFLTVWQTIVAVTLSVYPTLMFFYFRGAQARLWMST